MTIWVELEGAGDCLWSKWHSWDLTVSFYTFMEAVLKI